MGYKFSWCKHCKHKIDLLNRLNKSVCPTYKTCFQHIWPYITHTVSGGENGVRNLSNINISHPINSLKAPI